MTWDEAPKREPRTEVAGVALSQSEKKELRAAATLLDISISQLLRVGAREVLDRERRLRGGLL